VAYGRSGGAALRCTRPVGWSWRLLFHIHQPAQLVTSPGQARAQYILVIAGFLLGALAGGRLLRAPLAELRFGFAVEWGLLLAALLLTVQLHPESAKPAREIVTSLLAFAMGVQNALLRKHGIPDLATNVMTLTAAGLVADSVPAGGHNENWRRRFASIAIFLVSATVGAVLTTRLGPWAPLALTVALFTVALTGLVVRDGAAGKD